MITKLMILKKMGIRCWSQRIELPLRSTLIQAKSDQKESVLCYCYYWKKHGNPVACLFAEYGNGSLEESNLVAAIANALPWPAEGGCQEVSANASQLPVIILGKKLNSELALPERDWVFVSHSPLELLADPTKKRDAWEKLQKLKFSLGGTQGF